MTVPGNANPLLLRSAAPAAYQVSRSLRFNSADSAYLSRTPASAGNRRTWTFSAWVKRSSLGVFQSIFNCIASDASYYTQFIFETSDKFVLYDNLCPGGVAFTTTQVFRDTSAWFHFLLYYDTTQSTASAKAKLYINGIEVTQFDADNRSSLTSDSSINRTAQHVISGRLPYTGGSSGYLSGYLAEVHFVDGQALTPSNFTETDATTGQLIPKLYSGSYGTNGFKLTFADNSAATASTLGKDTANSNNWTPNNFSVTAGAGNDSLVDTPTSYGTDTGAGGEVRGNYCTANPLDNASITLANGNLDLSSTSAAWANIRGTIGMSSGKWYWEVTCTGVSNSNNYATLGIAGSGAFPSGGAFHDLATGYAYYSFNGQKYNSGSGAAYGNTYTTNDVIGIALDLDAGTLKFYKNGTVQNSGTAAYTGLSGTFFPAVGLYGSSCSVVFNAGQRAFAYAAPANHKALCDTNLTAPVIAKPSTVMNVKLYTGNGSTQTISGLGFSPDLVWCKVRSHAFTHNLFDSVRGVNKTLYSNLTNAENTWTDKLTAFNSDGFSLGADATGTGECNVSGHTYVAWTWDAGTSTVTNNVGSITSTVRANASAGFSIISFTGNETVGATLGHGLGAKPGFAIFKDRNSGTRGFYCYHSSLGATQAIQLSSTAAASASSFWFNNTEPTSTVFTLANNSVINGASSMICWAWAPVAGYSSMGSYVGNGSSDGPFVFTGFRPRWLLLKQSSSAGEDWLVIDSSRSAYNVVGDLLLANSSNAEAVSSVVDFLSNGFKLRVNTGAATNANGSTYVWAAFAESPFPYARAR